MGPPPAQEGEEPGPKHAPAVLGIYLNDIGNWDRMNVVFHEFFSAPEVKQAYRNWVEHVVTRTNSVTGLKYNEDPAVFAWELANEPRCKGGSVFDADTGWVYPIPDEARGLGPATAIWVRAASRPPPIVVIPPGVSAATLPPEKGAGPIRLALVVAVSGAIANKYRSGKTGPSSNEWAAREEQAFKLRGSARAAAPAPCIHGESIARPAAVGNRAEEHSQLRFVKCWAGKSLLDNPQSFGQSA